MMTKSGGSSHSANRGGIMILTLIVSVSVPLVPTFVFGQDRPVDQTAQERGAAVFARVQALQARHMVTVRGAQNPSGIPRGQLYRIFFNRLSAEAPSPSDNVAFAQFARERFGAMGTDADVLNKFVRDVGVEKPRVNIDICLRVLDGSLPDGVSIAKYVTEVDQQAEKDDETRFQAIVDTLSPSVRTTVTQRALVEGAAKAVSATLDHAGMALEDADLYKVMMTGLCRGRKSANSSTANGA